MAEHPDRSHLVRHVQDESERYLLHYGEGFLYVTEQLFEVNDVSVVLVVSV